MDKKVEALFLLLVILFQTLVIASPNKDDMMGLKSLENIPPQWKGSDPCGTKWEGFTCTNSSVTSIKLSSMGLKGQLTEDTEHLFELKILDLSDNKYLRGQLPESIGNLKNLIILTLSGCGFSGKIPASIGNLPELRILSLNSNNFNGQIPPSIGSLSKLVWLDLTDNKIEGPIPVSNGVTSGLDMLLQCKHFHLGMNKLTGPIPEQLFNSNMTLRHVLLDSNKLTGTIPFTIGRVLTLEVIDMSKNNFEESDFPLWYSSLRSLRMLSLDEAKLGGKIPSKLFSFPNLTVVKLNNNFLSGALEINTSDRDHLKLIELKGNSIMEFENANEMQNVQIVLVGNPICGETVEGDKPKYCYGSVSTSDQPYETKKHCTPAPCKPNQTSSPKCACAYPYKGTLYFKAPPFFDLGNKNYYEELEKYISTCFRDNSFPVDTISLGNPNKSHSEYLEIKLEIFPQGGSKFNRTEVSEISFCIRNLTYRPPGPFEVFYFISDPYLNFAEVPAKDKSKWTSSGMIGEAVGGSTLVLLILLVGMYVFLRKRKAERTENSKTLACCVSNKRDRRTPQLKGARLFSFKELKQYTKNFSPEKEIGAGGYGKVYLGTLPTGELIAIKRAKAQTKQSEAEFITEIELLSRVHHKNLVSLVGFCFEQREQMLIYEYVPNGTLKDSLLGKSGFRLSWTDRLKVALDTAKGLAYLHELANPPIIHRDIKSTNILLDDQLNAKVADFGLSKPLFFGEKDHVSTQVKGTAGYLDPEYYMTQRLTERSDVYSFGVLMLELINARKPIERGKFIVKEVRTLMNKSKDLYNLQVIIDPAIGLVTKLNGFERFLELAMRCVEDVGVNRPTMSEVVKEIETILQLVHLKPYSDSASTFMSYEGSNETTSIHQYGEESLD